MVFDAPPSGARRSQASEPGGLPADSGLDPVLAQDSSGDPAGEPVPDKPDPAPAFPPHTFLDTLDLQLESTREDELPDAAQELRNGAEGEAAPAVLDPAAPNREEGWREVPPAAEFLADLGDIVADPLPDAPESPAGDVKAGDGVPEFDPATRNGGADSQEEPPASDFLADFENLLVEGLSEDSASSSGDPLPKRELPAFDPAMPAGDGAPGPDAAGPRSGDGEEERHRPTALAFAMDPETENALREGLSKYPEPSSGHGDPQVRTGGLRAAVDAFAGGRSARLVIVDIDGVPYPAGAIHELAEVCEMGTAVIAIGSDRTARSSRELLLAGVSDYLVKPVGAAAVREAAARAALSRPGGLVAGSVVGFTGTGGSGTTTLLAATALQAANRGRYVSVLDLNRTSAASAVVLDVEPAAGLDQVLDEVYAASPNPQLLDGVRVQRSQRISVYAYRWSTPPPPVASIASLEWLLEELRQRSQLVLVDGMDDCDLRFALLARADTRVVVAEPTGRDALRAARVLDVLGDDAPVLLVRNQTRAFKRIPEAGPFRRAGADVPPDVDIPFDASLPAIADRGWPQGRLPRGLREPLADLTDRVLMAVLPGEAPP